MVEKKQLCNKVWLCTVIAIWGFQATMSPAEVNREELLNLLREKDRISETGGYKISFLIVTRDNPFKDPNQGMLIRHCEATRTTQGSFAMKITNYYEHPPVFAAPGFGNYRYFDYDEKGNLIVWRSLEKYVLSAPERNDTLEKRKVFVVDPNGQTVRTHINITLLRFPIGSPDNMYEFNQFQLATGRGFSKLGGSIASVKSLPSGQLKLSLETIPSAAAKGAWELCLDPNSDYLVREAIFTKDGKREPTQVIMSYGATTKDELTIAKYGTFRFSNVIDLSVQVTNISKIVGPNHLYEEVLSFVNSPLPPGSSILDLRGEKPVRTNVK